MAWWELSEGELAQNEGARELKQAAYFNTFYGSDSGREVLLDVQRACYAMNDPVASVALIKLVNQIRANCGVNTFVEMQAIKAEAKYIQH